MDCIPCALGTSQPLGRPLLGATYCCCYKIASSAIRAAETLTHLLEQLPYQPLDFAQSLHTYSPWPITLFGKVEGILVVDFLAVIH